MKKIKTIFIILFFCFFAIGCASLETIAGIAVTGYSIYEIAK